MTDISSLMPHADSQLNSIPPFASASASAPSDPPSHPDTNGQFPQVDGVAEGEESSIIKCFCGYLDDDGNTVLCEVCNTWQHIECYYPNVDVPEEHFCLDCSSSPQAVDVKAATERQRRLRELQSVEERKARRAPGKTQKKRANVKESGPPYINGWTHEGRERASGSPKEEPPLKRPKTSHRASGSVSSLNQTRKRAGSGLPAKQSPTVSPPTLNGYSGDYFSPEFMQLHRQQAAFSPIESNSYTGLNIPDSLHNWLKDPDALGDATHGKTPAAIFQRIDTPFEELEKQAPSITKHSVEEKSITVQDQHPILQWLAIDSAVPPNAYVGELKGRIGLQDEYFNDPSNRWDVLHHPEPFVFFPPHLPIYIDARTEGSQLRYVRRSCQPNLRMQIIIADDTNYHFCFVSKCEINAGDELTVAWDLDEKTRQILHHSVSNGNARKEGIHGADDAYISHWATGVLVNFGGCACTRPQGVCWLERFDRRNNQHWKDASTTLKPKGKKGKKGANQASPLSTGHATNSRAGSEAIRDEPDEENGDGRSATGSSKSKPASRDITPMMHVDGMKNELSGRDRKKLQDVEKLFKQQEYEEQHGRKKKRNSGGSALNTPTVATSSSRSDVSDPRRRGSSVKKQFPDFAHPSPTASTARSPSHLPNGVAHAPSPLHPARLKHPRAEYTSMSTQTDPDASVWIPSPVRATPKGPILSRKRRLLERARRDRICRLEASESQSQSPHIPSTASSPTQIKAEPAATKDAESDTAMPPPRVLSEPDPASTSVPEIEMPDVDDTNGDGDGENVIPPPTESEPAPRDPPPLPTAAIVTTKSESPHPLAPPWPSDKAPAPSSDQTAPPPSEFSPVISPRTALPPLPTIATTISPAPPHPLPTPSPSILPTLSTTTTNSTTSNSTTQTPSNANSTSNHLTDSPYTLPPLPPLLSPSLTHALGPSPLKKKMSLSDYTNRKKKAAGAGAGKPSRWSEGDGKEEGKEGDRKEEEEGKEGERRGEVDSPMMDAVTEEGDSTSTTREAKVEEEEGDAMAVD
ncbi:hypothetical protein P152DRAFT_313783 [Eremomyces bilateralis CBS 781.70]|uniref:SET domain-containing protein n=1 Tax=Eremomyces bilateralis CBS 781.70 TaxID=1392243 RepID=A0A6G1G609_9PEZI|nr:uncharacterized protein P152DRAFT_313783 [Eremomyces bilateralis CBS 781.70]KAF1813310.1 hypothetical protein P152DRAFT_313783 [Eremomyces bilateralis CBS 781.70]